MRHRLKTGLITPAVFYGQKSNKVSQPRFREQINWHSHIGECDCCVGVLLHIATREREVGSFLHSGKRAEDGKDNIGLADEGALNCYAQGEL